MEYCDIVNAALCVFAGDDLTLSVDFFDGAAPVDITSAQKIEMVLHYGAQKIVYPASEILGSAAKFYLSTAETERLLAMHPSGRYQYCIHIYWSETSRSTAVHRAIMEIREC